MQLTAQFGTDQPDAPVVPGAYYAVRVPPGSTVQLGVTGTQKFDGSAPFTIGFWVRLLSAGSPVPLMSRPGAFAIGLQNNQVAFGFGDWGSTATVSAQWPLSLSDWHYVVVTYAPTTGTNAGVLTFYIDSATASDALSVTGTGSDALQPFVIGGANAADMEIMSVCLWSVCLSEAQCTDLWSMPSPGAPGLVAAFDFADRTPAEVSGNNYPVTLQSAYQTVIFPALALAGAGYAQFSSQDSVTFASGSDPFTIQMDVLPVYDNQIGVGEHGTCLSIVDAKSSARFTISIDWLSGEGTSVYPMGLVATGSGGQMQSPPSTFFGGNIAVTYDGSTLTLYIGGQSVASHVAGALPQISEPIVVVGAIGSKSGSVTNPFNGYIQQLSIWEACLDPDDLVQYMSTDPVSDPRCIAYVPFNEAAPTNVITDEPVALLAGAVIGEDSYPVYASSANALARRAAPNRFNRVAAPPSRSAMLQLAEELKIDGSVRPKTDLATDAEIDEIIGHFEDILARIPQPYRKSLRVRFTRNLYTGLALHAATGGKLPGQVTWRQTPDAHIYSVETGSGTKEILRLDRAAISPCVAWCISVAAQCVVIVLGIFGLGFAVRGIYDATKTALQRSPTIVEFFKSTTSVNGMLPVQVLNTIYNAGQLGPILVSGLANVSWWNWIFTIANVMLRIAAIWLTGGAYLAAMVANIALDLAKLLVLYKERPANCP